MRFELKQDPAPFQDVWDGKMLYQLRVDDRKRAPGEGIGYMVGDELLLRETSHTGEVMHLMNYSVDYTGREVLCVVTQKLTGYGLQEGWCSLGIKRLELRGRMFMDIETIKADQPKDPVRHEHVKTRDPLYKAVAESAFAGTPMADHTHTAGVGVNKTATALAVAWDGEGMPYCFAHGRNTHVVDCKTCETTLHARCSMAEQAKVRAKEFDAEDMLTKRPFSHYFRPCPYDGIDVYRTLEIFGVTSPAIQHAIKKLLVPGRRGSKDVRKDLSEAVVSINRAIEMMDEDKLD